MTGAPAEGETDEPPLDGGPFRGRRAPERTCIVMRAVKPPDAMIRFVLSGEGVVTPDLKARLPGRGAWVSATRADVETAIKRRQFNRAFRTERALAPPDLAERIAESLRTDLRQALAMANKAGCIVSGFAKVEAEIGGRAGIVALVHASDGSADGRRKLAAALRRRLGDAICAVPIIDDLPNAELDMALGRDHVIHAALVAGPGATGCLARWRRLRTFEGVPASAEAIPVRRGATATDLHDDMLTDRPGPARVADQCGDETLKGSD